MFLENTVNHKEQFGWIEVICGSMFSGKTEELIRRLKRAQFAKQRVEIFKPAVDVRYDDEEVVSASYEITQEEEAETVEQQVSKAVVTETAAVKTVAPTAAPTAPAAPVAKAEKPAEPGFFAKLFGSLFGSEEKEEAEEKKAKPNNRNRSRGNNRKPRREAGALRRVW